MCLPLYFLTSSMNIPQNIIVHHTLVSRTKNPNQFDAVNDYHKRQGWGKIGYHYLIEPDGTIKKGREENETGAHTKEKMMNYRSIGICLTGNFDEEEPTLQQCKALHSIITQLQAKHKIKDSRIFPHRHFAPKSCWGSKLPNDVLGYLRMRIKGNDELEDWQKELFTWASEDIKDIKKLMEGNIWSILALVKRKLDKLK